MVGCFLLLLLLPAASTTRYRHATPTARPPADSLASLAMRISPEAPKRLSSSSSPPTAYFPYHLQHHTPDDDHRQRQFQLLLALLDNGTVDPETPDTVDTELYCLPCAKPDDDDDDDTGSYTTNIIPELFGPNKLDSLGDPCPSTDATLSAETTTGNNAPELFGSRAIDSSSDDDPCLSADTKITTTSDLDAPDTATAPPHYPFDLLIQTLFPDDDTTDDARSLDPDHDLLDDLSFHTQAPWNLINPNETSHHDADDTSPYTPPGPWNDPLPI